MSRLTQAREIANKSPRAAQEPICLSNFAKNVFTDTEIASRVPRATYKSYKAAVKAVRPLEPHVANVIANAMKDWAVERGATHFTHWFHPIHISTAEKHESFVTPRGDDFQAILEFTGDQLVRGEPDASSFPNGGTRSTSRARGYTTWDPTSPAFIRSGTNGATLYIPTCFCSWTGDALDVKTPLLRSNYTISNQAVRLLRLMGNDEVEHVLTTLGPEQEFFVVDRSLFVARPDLVFAGRTLFGSKPPKGQELEDHYFATIPSRVFAYIQEVESELWKLGIPSRARHNEVAPAQHEMAPVFEHSNIATDHNMITMELLRETAARHGLACLLHEKPFANVNGSGKHNNWSLATNTGINLLEPSHDPKQNLVFQAFLACILRAVDIHADLLRASIATPGNDWRLGMAEAPPAIVSVYLGADLMELVQWILAKDLTQPAKDLTTNELKGSSLASSLLISTSSSDEDVARPDHSKLMLHLGSKAVAPFRRDRTDRNRTSPFAFTGNKFEFRAVGSSQNVGHTITILNTIVADAIRSFADDLEAILIKSKKDEQGAYDQTVLQNAVLSITQRYLKQHERIIFEGDGYSNEWIAEAAKRGLPNLTETVAALDPFCSEANIELFQSLGVLKRGETLARYNIYLEHYINTLQVEANVALDIATTQIIPAVVKYQTDLATSLDVTSRVLKLVPPSTTILPQINFLENITKLLSELVKCTNTLRDLVSNDIKYDSRKTHAVWVRDVLKPAILQVRSYTDQLESIVDDKLWPMPKYVDLFFTK